MLNAWTTYPNRLHLPFKEDIYHQILLDLFPVCFFCGESSGDFHKVSTLRLDARVRKCAMLLQDTNLLGKLSSGDMIAQDTVYHAKCLLTLYRNADAVNMLGA